MALAEGTALGPRGDGECAAHLRLPQLHVQLEKHLCGPAPSMSWTVAPRLRGDVLPASSLFKLCKVRAAFGAKTSSCRKHVCPEFIG